MTEPGKHHPTTRRGFLKLAAAGTAAAMSRPQAASAAINDRLIEINSRYKRPILAAVYDRRFSNLPNVILLETGKPAVIDRRYSEEGKRSKLLLDFYTEPIKSGGEIF